MKKEIEEKLREIGYLGKIDLETILGALPNKINVKHLDFESNEVYLNLNNSSIGYYADSRNDNASLFSLQKEENESLADTAARLLILIYEKGLVEF